LETANEAKILGPKDIYIQEGSTLNLTCVVPRSRSRARSRTWSVQWERGAAKLPATSARTAVTTIIEDYEAISNLMVFNTRASDTGKYKCYAATTKPGIVNINIIKGQLYNQLNHISFDCRYEYCWKQREWK
jgi:hypothetical protein